MKKISSVLLATLFIIPSVSSASIDTNLKYGQKNSEVSELQEFLIDKGFLKGSRTGFFGLLTLKAVKSYQSSVNISPTGYVGALTREKINSEVVAEVITSSEAERKEVAVSVTKPSATLSNEDGVYDSNIKFDKLGRKVFITQVPNYKLTNIVRANLEVFGTTTVSGFYYKDTKSFMTEEDLNYLAKVSQDATDKEFGRGVYAPQSSTTTQNNTVVYITPTRASFSGSGRSDSPYGASFSFELKNMSDKIIEISSVTYKITTDDSYDDANLPIKIGKNGTVLDESTYAVGSTNFITYKFQRPLVVFAKDVINLTFEYPVKIKTLSYNVTSTRLLINSIETNPAVSFSTLPIETKATYHR